VTAAPAHGPDPPPPPWLTAGEVPSLNGLRAAAVGLVLLAHFADPYAPASLSRQVSTFGWVGVDLFFVVSGFIITTLLLRERDRAGRVSLRAFYTRRALRLLPAYYAYLLAVALAWPEPLTDRDWVGVLTYTQNFTPGLGSWPVSHFWSLSLEEHFYLVWPAAIALLGPRGAARLAAAVVVVSPALRAAALRYIPPDPTGHPAAFLTWCRADTIAAGCLLAFVARTPGGRRLLGRLDRRPVAHAAVALAVVFGTWAALPLFPAPAVPFYFTLLAAGLTTLVWLAVARPASAAGKVLNSRPVVWVGVLSYSLYVWQQPFSDPRGGAWWQGLPVGPGLAVGCAVLSRYLVERPFLRVKDRLGRARHG
jgi:peptidoglycan/LPS O-acetylase OafA/YrhL